jgi:hypothetical protein
MNMATMINTFKECQNKSSWQMVRGGHIYLENEINSEEKTDKEINRRIQNSCI